MMLHVCMRQSDYLRGKCLSHIFGESRILLIGIGRRVLIVIERLFRIVIGQLVRIVIERLVRIAAIARIAFQRPRLPLPTYQFWAVVVLKVRP